MTEIHEEINKRIEKLSTFLDVDKSKLANASIIFGLYKYLLPYQMAEDTFDEQYELDIKLKDQIESDYEIIHDLEKIEKDFGRKFQDRTFTTYEEWRNAFLNYIEIPGVEEVEHIEESIQKKESIPPALKRKSIRKKIEKVMIKREKPEFPIKLLPKEKIGMYFFFPSVLSLVILMYLWTFFSEFKFLQEYEMVTTIILVSFSVIGLGLHQWSVGISRYFIHKHGLFLLISAAATFIIFVIARVSKDAGYIWLLNPLVAFLLLIVIPIVIIGFIVAFYYQYFPNFEEWKDKRNIKKMTYRFIAENPYGTFKNSTERAQAFAGFIQDPKKVGDLLE